MKPKKEAGKSLEPTNKEEDSQATLNQTFSSAIEMLQYNPNFTLTPEVIELLQKCFHSFQVDENGKIKIKEIREFIEKFRKTDLSVVPFDDLQSDSIDFDDFCDLIVQWKESYPKGLERLYLSWIIKYLSEAEEGFAESIGKSVKPKISSKEAHEVQSEDQKLMWRRLAAGGLAGCLTKTCFAPLDRVKIIFQTGDLKLSLREAFSLGKTIYTRDGFFALFKGNAVMIIRAFPYAAIQHSSYDYFKRKVIEYSDNRYQGKAHTITNSQMILAGSLAGACSVACTYPLDVLRARLAVQQGKSSLNGIIGSYRHIYRADGAMSFMRGLFPTLLGILPYTGIGFWLNDYFKHKLYSFQSLRSSATNRNQLLAFPKLLCGYSAGTVALIATYPLDTVRRRMQTDGYITPKSSVRRYTGTVQTTLAIIEKEGVFRGLYKGISLSLIKAPLAIAVSLTTYDIFKELMGVESSSSFPH